MTQVLEHNYGKGKVTRRQIRAAIKAVRADDTVSVEVASKPVARKAVQKPTPAKGK